MINIVLVEDHRIVRDGIKGLLELQDNFSVIGEAADGEQALVLLQQQQPDVMLLDIRMPKMDGLALLNALGDNQPKTLILTTFDDHELVLDCLKAGAKGYMRKDVSLDALSDAIEKVAAGQSWLQPAVTDRIEQQKDKMTYQDQQLVQPLTPIEQQVLSLIAAGFSNNEIAQALHKSVGTVRNQVSFVLQKLDVRDRTRAVLKAIDLGLL